MKITSNNVLTIARSYLGYSAGESAYTELLKIYNSRDKITPEGKLTAADEWSGAFISICFIQAKGEKLIGVREKDISKLIARFKKRRIWHEKDKPLKVGDLVVLTGYKMGIVEAIHGRVIVLILGDKNGTIGRLRILNSDDRIVGSARPKYATEKQATDEVAAEVLMGKWGNGRFLKKKLTDAGYDYDKIQRRVCELS